MNCNGKDTITVGDIVRLKSGSPDLAVVSVKANGAMVEWPTANSEMQRHVFPQACLTVVRKAQ